MRDINNGLRANGAFKMTMDFGFGNVVILRIKVFHGSPLEVRRTLLY
jgi:hypothetical protein